MTERWMTIRVYGTLLHATDAWGGEDDDPAAASPLTEEHIDGWMRACAENGVTGVLWQSNCGGLSTHPSPVFPLAGPPFRPHNEHWTPVWEYLGEQVRRFDTLSVAIAAAHKHGLRFAYSLCTCDFVDSPFDESVFHPNLWVMSRRGEPYHGVPCYAEPKVQDLMLEHVVDVLDRGVDDLAISFFSHMIGQGVNQPNYYGFNQPALEAYERQHGHDPLRDGVDESLWRSLHGDYYTEFIRRLHEQTDKRGQRLIACATRDGLWGWGGSAGQLMAHYTSGQGKPTAAPAFSLEYQWRRWAKEGIADALIVIDSLADAEAVRQESELPVILWRDAGPALADPAWSKRHEDAAKVAAGPLDGFAAHAMFLVDRDGYLDKLWMLMRSATGS